jgi:hypothetical protein
MSEGSSKSRSGSDAPRATRPEPDAEVRNPSSAVSRAIASARTPAAEEPAREPTRIMVETAHRAVTSSDDPARDGVRLGVIAFTTAVSFAGLLALGAIAGRVGADVWIGAGSLDRSMGETFVTGVRLPLAMLRALYASGVDDPLFFAFAMALLIPPIAALAAARPHRSGGPQSIPAVLNAARLGAALVIAAAIGVAVRLANIARPTISDAIPSEPWLDRVQSLAAADAISMAFAILLAVLVFRLPVDRWVRALAGTIAISVAVASTVAAAASSGIADEVERPRPIISTESGDASFGRLLLGTTADGGCVMLGSDGSNAITVESRGSWAVLGRESIADALITRD